MNEAHKMLVNETGEELKKLILNLGRYTAKKCKRYYWRTGNSLELPQGETFDSIVSKALIRIIRENDRGRRWNPDKHPNFTKYMMGVIDSILYHLAKNSDNRFFKSMPEGIEIANFEISSVTNSKGAKVIEANWLQHRNLSPEEILIRANNALQAENTLNRLKVKIKGDIELEKIVAAIEDGCEKSNDKEIEKVTGIDIKTVRSAKKRLERRIDSVSTEFINSQTQA